MAENLAKIGQLNNTAHQRTRSVLIRCLKTCIEMLKDRGHTNIQACQTVDEIQKNMADNRFIVSGCGVRTAHVFFHNEDKVGVKQMRAWIEGSHADRILIVSLDGPTAFTRKEAEGCQNRVQFFTFRDVCVNIAKHSLVPQHERVAETDVPYGLSKSKSELPVLASSDKIAQYYAYEPGDIVRITRTAGVKEPVYYYRIVRNIHLS